MMDVELLECDYGSFTYYYSHLGAGAGKNDLGVRVEARARWFLGKRAGFHALGA